MHPKAQSSAGAEIRRRRSASRRPRTSKRPPLPCPVFIAYADVPAARGAAALYARFLATSHPDYELQPMFWRFDQLDSRHWGEMALRDATRASAIVIALSDDAPMHSAAEAWLTSLAMRHKGGSVRVTALLNEEPWTISLEQAGPAGTVTENGAALFALPGKAVAEHAA